MGRKKWVVTGASGFLGRKLVERALAEGGDVIGLDLEPAPTETATLDRYTHHVLDIRNEAEVNAACTGAKYVIHAAAGLPILRNRDEIFSINIEGTRIMLELAKKFDAKFCFISTTAVYGFHKIHPITEDINLIPVGHYGESKIAAEKLCEAAREWGHISVVRPKTFLGPGRLGVFEILFDWIHDGRKIPLLGKGNNRYQLLHVDDLVDAVFITLNDPHGNDTFNVAANKFDSLRNDLTPLFQKAGFQARFISLPVGLSKLALGTLDVLRLSPLTKWHYGTMASDSYVETSKIVETLGWNPRFSNQEILMQSYDWYHANHDVVKSQTGTSHTVGWDQKALKYFKKIAR